MCVHVALNILQTSWMKWQTLKSNEVSLTEWYSLYMWFIANNTLVSIGNASIKITKRKHRKHCIFSDKCYEVSSVLLWVLLNKSNMNKHSQLYATPNWEVPFMRIKVEFSICAVVELYMQYCSYKLSCCRIKL